MSVHVEWMSAKGVRPELARKGDEMADGQRIDTEYALVLGENEALVIEGSLAELQKLATGIQSLLYDAIRAHDDQVHEWDEVSDDLTGRTLYDDPENDPGWS